MTTTSNDSLRSSSDCTSRQTSSMRSSHLSSAVGSSVRSEFCTTDTADTEMQSEGTRSSSDIEIGSLQSTSTVGSEELRWFYNDTWSVGSFIAGGS